MIPTGQISMDVDALKTGITNVTGGHLKVWFIIASILNRGN